MISNFSNSLIGQWLLGKAMNGFCPIGPSIVTPDEIADPHHLNLKCIVNGVTKQDSNTKQLVFKTEEIVSWCSKFCTLLPGDLILTGTPPGVGCFKNPPEFLKVGFFFIILVKIWDWSDLYFFISDCFIKSITRADKNRA